MSEKISTSSHVGEVNIEPIIFKGGKYIAADERIYRDLLRQHEKYQKELQKKNKDLSNENLEVKQRIRSVSKLLSSAFSTLAVRR